ERMHGSLGANESGLGVHLESVLAGRDWQAALSDEDLALAHVSVAADVTEERHYWPGAEHPTAMMLRQGGGLGRTVRMDTGLAADYQELLAELLPRVRALIDDGFLLPPEQ